MLRSVTLGHSRGERGEWAPLLRFCVVEGTAARSEPRARVGLCPALPYSTPTSEDCKILVPQRGSSPSRSRVAFLSLGFVFSRRF